MAAKRVTGSFQLRAQRAEIVDFAVEHHADFAFGAVDRLMPSGDIDDRQATHSQERTRIAVQTLVIGTAMANRFSHCAAQRR